jgi:glycerate 2-kinase
VVRSQEGSLTDPATLRTDALAIAQAAIAAVDPFQLVLRALSDRQAFALDDAPIHVLAAGKAAGPMITSCLQVLSRPARSALAIGIDTPVARPEGVEWRIGGHPVPTRASQRAGLRALERAGEVGPADTLIVLLSGGASALMAAPVHGVTLEDKRRTTSRLLGSGADITALNAVRKHLSRLKGGRLAAAVHGKTVCLAVSDVVGDDLSVIGSGPTVADPTSFGDALAVLDRHGGRRAFPDRAVAALEHGARGDLPETPKPGDTALARASTHLIGGARDAIEGARAEAIRRGYGVHVCDQPVVGEARDAASAHADRIRSLAEQASAPLCVLSSGETTVHVTGSGKGGRNQEFALALALSPVLSEICALTVSMGTDGIDGPTDAAGAVADWTTIARARAAGLHDPAGYLRRNDSYRFFEAVGDLVRTGPTGTNVGDVQVVLLTGPRRAGRGVDQ